jgi:hypothetical protein
MEEQVPSSQIPGNPIEPQPQPQGPLPGQITPEQLELMKARAKEIAIQQAMAQQRAMAIQAPSEQPKVIYVRRNLTVAELILVFVISCGIVTGLQYGWNVVSNVLPRIEIKVK